MPCLSGGHASSGPDVAAPFRRKVPYIIPLLLLGLLTFNAGCTMVGPDFVKPEAPVADSWLDQTGTQLRPEAEQRPEWWQLFNDPVLNDLIKKAYQQNLDLQVTGLRVLEARAQLGLVTGQFYPQQQRVGGGATIINGSKNGANTLQADLNYTDYTAGFDAAWELDFWGKFRRGIEAADAGYIAAIASYDDVLVALTAEVARSYTLIRELQERIAIANENIAIQKRSLEIARARFEGGLVTELDVQQAVSLLRDTQALVPRLETVLRQTTNALSTLLGMPPSNLDDLLAGPPKIPQVPAEVAVGVPAELLRRRPDVRRAELQAAAQSALIGVARADLYPHFSLVGSIGLRSSNAGLTKAGGIGGSSFSDLFNGDSLELFAGPTFSWDIFNYGRIKNQVRIQDARFQQLAVNYQNTVLRAAREVEDEMIAFLKDQEQSRFLADSVAASKRSVDIALIQYREGVVDYQRVLDTQRVLAAAQDRYIETNGSVVLDLVGLYKALGGGWQIRGDTPLVNDETRKQMAERTDWGKLLQPDTKPSWRLPDW
ncbi:efflux transporter outer membrane subunit [Geothermobacter hydrogeniphilus]|nr:efflux transporter outer membrane subunit [Geothermobacter hydrogeniphilus]